MIQIVLVLQHLVVSCLSSGESPLNGETAMWSTDVKLVQISGEVGRTATQRCHEQTARSACCLSRNTVACMFIGGAESIRSVSLYAVLLGYEHDTAYAHKLIQTRSGHNKANGHGGGNNDELHDAAMTATALGDRVADLDDAVGQQQPARWTEIPDQHRGTLVAAIGELPCRIQSLAIIPSATMDRNRARGRSDQGRIARKSTGRASGI